MRESKGQATKELSDEDIEDVAKGVAKKNAGYAVLSFKPSEPSYSLIVRWGAAKTENKMVVEYHSWRRYEGRKAIDELAAFMFGRDKPCAFCVESGGFVILDSIKVRGFNSDDEDCIRRWASLQHIAQSEKLRKDIEEQEYYRSYNDTKSKLTQVREELRKKSVGG